MSSWLSRTAASHRGQLIITAVASGTIVAGIILTFQSLRRRERVEDLKHSIPPADEEHTRTLAGYGAPPQPTHIASEDEQGTQLALRAQRGDYDSELITEQLARNRVFLTPPGQLSVESAFVIVVGCGGVGSHVAAALARSGVSKIRLIDFDQVTLSSLNRHAVATLADVGTPKVLCLKKRLEQIAPWIRFDCRNELFAESSAEELLGKWKEVGVDSEKRPDWVVDAIDNIQSKVELLSYTHKEGISVISSMGAGCKSDSTRVLVGDISTSTDDPLSRSTRRLLRLKGIASGIPVVYSSEKPGPGKAELLPLPEEEFEKGQVEELGILPNFRVRILPVLGTMPAIFGYTVASYVILQLAKYPLEYASGKTRDKSIDAAQNSLLSSECHMYKSFGEDAVGLQIAIAKDDFGYLLEEVFRGRSVISRLSTRLQLIRWRQSDNKTIDTSVPGQKVSRLRLADLVCMTRAEALAHEKEVLIGGRRPEDVYSEDVCELVKRRAEEETAFDRFR
ncbi:MAG: hypothetical protein M1814_000727 [Vezdaea aestivalis]|nr:MAG: hypothetical protein M1814_000727 [Vezdaea aestivalis]